MTWMTTWPIGNSQTPQYAAHDTEQQAEAHAAELIRSKRAYHAVVFWVEEEVA